MSAAVACALCESTSGLGLSSKTIASKYLNMLTVSSACPLTVMSFGAPSVLLLAMVWGFSALISKPYAFEVLSSCFTKFLSSLFVPARPSMLSANQGW